jgi:hypothetical protein
VSPPCVRHLLDPPEGTHTLNLGIVHHNGHF